jgi:hypothetical protein
MPNAIFPTIYNPVVIMEMVRLEVLTLTRCETQYVVRARVVNFGTDFRHLLDKRCP